MAKVGDLYGAGTTGRMLQPQLDTPKVRKFLQQRHAGSMNGYLTDNGVYVRGDHSWKVPLGVRLALSTPLIHVQIVNKYPWAVTWHSPKSGKRLQKRFNNLHTAIHFVATRAQYVDPHASIFSRQRGYDLPARLRRAEPLPKPWVWCPRCMQPRKYRRSVNAHGEYTTFQGNKKFKTDKGVYEWKVVELALLRCRYCGCTNRDIVFRRSNQPWEVRKFKKGVTRARRRRRR